MYITPKGLIRQAYMQEFGFQGVTFKEAINMFEIMDIDEKIVSNCRAFLQKIYQVRSHLCWSHMEDEGQSRSEKEKPRYGCPLWQAQ